MKRKIQFSRLFMGFSSVSLFLLLLATLTQVQSSIAAEETKEQTAVNTAINPQSDLAISQRFPSNLIQPKNATGPAIYIVALKDIPLATYDGSIPGLAATNPTVRGETKLDAKSADSVAYLNYLSQRRADVINQANTVLGRQLEIMFEYGASINGFAAEMTPDEASLVAQLPNVFLVEREKIYELQTDAGPGWIGAPGVWDGSQTGGLPGTYGEGVIVGIIDTGVDPWNPSFADVGDDGYDHTNPFGSNNYVGVCDPTNLGGGGVVAFDPTFDCNDKLIGVWGYTASDPSPRDTDGHGSHTSSTAAGNFVYDAVITTTTAVFTANISGVAPHANLIVYDGCTDGAGCPGASLQAARDQAILDGVDVINYSIGGNSPTGNPWIDVEALSWLNVRAAGIFVADSAGNDGPGEASVDSPADIPWINPVAASSHNRTFLNSVTLDDGVNTPVTIEGESMTGPLSTPVEVVFAADYGVGDDYRLCAPGIFPANTFDGEIVICERGVYGRVDKGQSVLDGGGGGMILAQPAEFGGGPGALASDPHVLPAVHINYYEYQDLLAYMNNAPGAVMGTIAGSTLALGDEYGDIIASFSSRGPNESVPDLIAPYMAAPGRAIWAAYHQGAEDGQYTFNVIQGTSMASPHVAGAAALMVALHPDWSPAEIQSALMTTSDTTVVNDDGSTQATPFQMGAGRVSLADAAKAGFVLDVTTQEFIDANPGIGGDPKTLNLANIGNADCLNSCTWTRTISSTLPYTVSWVATTVSPLSATLSVEPVTFDLAPYGTQVITVTADTTAMPYGEWSFGQVNLEPAAAVLQLTKDDGGVTVTEGEDIAYTLSYENVGELAATNVIITETVPDNTTFNAAASTAGWTEASSGIYTFDVGSVVSSGNGTVLFVVTVDDPLAQGVTAIDNTAQITGDGLSVGSASDSTPVGEPTEFTIYLPVVFNASTNVASQSQRALNATMAVPVDLVSEAHFPVALYAEQPSPIIDVTPEDLSSSQTPDVSTTLPLTITNLGQADLEWSVYEGNAPVKMSGLGWADNFDSYATNSQLHGQGGWKGWGNDPNAGALAVSTQARSAPNSAEITGPSDLVQEYSGYTSGVWNYTAWQYIPGSFSGESYFILLNAYDDAGATNNWSTQVRFNSVGSVVIADGAGGGATLPLVTDQWVEIRVEIDLNNDQQTFYYDGQMLFQGSWTEGLSGGGQLAIGAVDLYANGATAVYYDDLSLTESGWSDNFDSYATNSQIHGQGGWKGWANDPNAGAIVVSTQARSTPNSVDITGPSDLVHEYSGYTSGAWNYTAWQYIPGDFTGESYFILLNAYDDAGASNNWSVQVHFNSVGDVVIADGVGGSATLPLTRDQWVEINVIIDLDNDSQSFYYDGQLLYQGSWTEGVSGGGQLNIGAVDLYANSASSIFYDDMSLTPTSAQGCSNPADVPWLSVTPTSGTTSGGASDVLDVTMDSTGLTAGNYGGVLCVSSNDPVNPLIQVPVSLAVIGNPPIIDVNPGNLDVTLPAGNSSTEALGISNVGVSGAANLNWNVDEANGALLRPAQETVGGAVDSVAYVAAEGFAFSTNPNPTETVLHGLPTRNPGTTITHSNSQTVVAGSVSCNSGGFHTDSSYYRAFDLPSFGITNAFEISSVDFGIEQATGNGGSQPVVVNLYAAPSGTAFPAAYPGSFTLIGTANVTVADQTLSVLNAPIAATAPANSVVVFELFTPSGQPDVNSFFVGSNAAGQTAPSYIAAAACGISSPIDLAAIGFPNMHIVMNVTGKVQAPATGCAAPSDIPWLSMTPTSGSTTQGATDNVDVTFDATALGTGVYTGTICVNSDDPVTPLVEVPVTLTVTPGGSTPGISVNKTVGTDPNVCAGTDQVTVASGTDVTYCYTVTNTGSITLTQHDLVDDQLGTLLTGFPYSLPPGGSAFLTATTNITATTVNIAIWTAYNPGPTDVASDTDTATVTVSGGGGTVTYCRNAIGLAIPDNSTTGVNDTVNVTESGTIQDVDVLVNATHSWDGDLVFMVTSPAATAVTIVDRPGYTGSGFGCSGDNYPNITLDDDGGAPGTPVETSCTNTVPGYTPNGFYTPNNPLSAFDGSNLNGTWTINASDRAAGDTGALADWCVTITYAP